MRRLYKFIVILTILIVAFLGIAYFVPGVKSAVDTAVGPNVVGFFGSVSDSIAPLYTHYITPWPNHAIVWVAVAFGFAWIVHKGFNRVRTVFVRSADAESGRTIAMREPMSSGGPVKPAPIAEKEEEKKEKTEEAT